MFSLDAMGIKSAWVSGERTIIYNTKHDIPLLLFERDDSADRESAGGSERTAEYGRVRADHQCIRVCS